MAKKTIFFIICIVVLALVTRCFFPNNNNLEPYELADVTNEHGHIYLYQFDSYAFYNAAMNDKEPGDFWSDQLKAFHRIFSSVDLILLMKIVAMVYVILTFVMVFYLCLELTDNMQISVFCTFLLILNKTFLLNSYWGYSDRNVINHFLIISIAYCAVLFFKKCDILYLMAYISLLFIFSNTWRGFFPIMLITIFSCVIWFVFNRFDRYNPAHISGLGAIILFMAYIIYSGWDVIALYLIYGGNFSSKYAMISEIAPIDVFWFQIAMVVVVLVVLAYICYRKIEDYGKIMVFIWLFCFSAAALRAQRHIFYLMPAFVISIAIIAKYLSDMRIKDFVMPALVFLCLLSLITTGLYINKTKIYPEMDNAIYDVMTYINQNTGEGTVILSWWDYGIMYEAYSNRTAVFKSVSPNNPAILDALFSIDAEKSKTILSGMAEDYVVVVNSADLEDVIAMREFSGLEFSKDSLLYMMIDMQEIEGFRLMRCSTSHFKRVCAYEGE